MYIDLQKQTEGRSPRTRHHVHIVLGACMATAHRTKLPVANPMGALKQIPSIREIEQDADEQEDAIGEGLTETELASLMVGFRLHPSIRSLRSLRPPAPAAMSCWRCAGATSVSRRKRSGLNGLHFSKEFARRAGVIGVGNIRFHDLRGIHATGLLDAGIPVHTVAQRIGDDPAVLLRSYAKRRRTKQASDALAAAISNLTSGFLRS